MPEGPEAGERVKHLVIEQSVCCPRDLVGAFLLVLVFRHLYGGLVGQVLDPLKPLIGNHLVGIDNSLFHGPNHIFHGSQLIRRHFIHAYSILHSFVELSHLLYKIIVQLIELSSFLGFYNTSFGHDACIGALKLLPQCPSLRDLTLLIVLVSPKVYLAKELCQRSPQGFRNVLLVVRIQKPSGHFGGILTDHILVFMPTVEVPGLVYPFQVHLLLGIQSGIFEVSQVVQLLSVFFLLLL